MKAAVLQNGEFLIKSLDEPSLAGNKMGAIVEVIGCGLCGSDMVKMYNGQAKDGSVLGHEVVGIIDDINSETEFCIGDKIVLGHHIPCFNCHYCWNGNYSMCKHFKATNIYPGGFAEYIFVSEEHLKNTVFRVNDNLPDVEASFLEPLACCIRAVRRAEVKDNSINLVIGLGSVGILMGGALNAFGHKVYGCDLKPERVELSKKYGFEGAVSIGENLELAIEKLREIAPIGFDNVFLTAGASATIDFAIKVVRDGGKILVFSSVKDTNGFMNNEIYYRELTVMGSYSPSPIDLEDSMQFIEQGKVKVSGLSTTYNIDDINDAIIDTRTNKIMKAFIKL